MSKFNQLLNENTIVDFGLLWRLTKRYRSHLLMAVGFFATFFAYNYFNQPVIYALNIPLKAVSQEPLGPSNPAQILSGGDSVGLSINELKISLENYSYMKMLAESVIGDPTFPEMNFGSIKTNNSYYGKEITLKCRNDRKCIVETLISQMRELYILEPGITENRFILNVKAVNKKTVQTLTGHLTKTIEANRIQVRKYQIIKEMESVKSLIDESRSLIQKIDGYTTLEEQEKIQNGISELKDRIKLLQQSSSQELSNVSALESKLNENKKSTTSNLGLGSIEVESLKKNQARLAEIRQNIVILSNIPESRKTTADKLVIEQLQAERVALQGQLPADKKRKDIELKDTFAASQRTKTSDYEFDYQVSKTKMAKINIDLEQAKQELSKLLEKKIENENKVVGLKSDMEFLKNLEAKQMSLKLISATMTSDVFFEDSNPFATEYRQSSYLKIILFSFSITMFLHIVSIIIRFLYDDKIYSEDDLKSKFGNLDFIGEVPKFG